MTGPKMDYDYGLPLLILLQQVWVPTDDCFSQAFDRWSRPSCFCFCWSRNRDRNQLSYWICRFLFFIFFFMDLSWDFESFSDCFELSVVRADMLDFCEWDTLICNSSGRCYCSGDDIFIFFFIFFNQDNSICILKTKVQKYFFILYIDTFFREHLSFWHCLGVRFLLLLKMLMWYQRYLKYNLFLLLSW